MIKKTYTLKRTPLKRSQKPLKRNPIKKKVKSLKDREEERIEQEKLWNFFLEIWNERLHYSELSGEWLGNEPLTTMFDHLLEKSTFPDYKFEKWNIALITPDEHSAKTNGFPLLKHAQMIEKAFRTHEILKDANR